MITGEQIRKAREAKGMSQDDLARAIGVRQPTIFKIENGQTTRSKYLSEIATVLDITESPFAAVARNMVNPPKPSDYDLPVYAAAEGGPGEMVVSTDPIDRVPRPWYLGTVKEGFAVLVVGESMTPDFNPGDLAVVNPKLPPARDKPVILVSGEEHGEFRATIKRLIGWSATDWAVRQFNPAKDFKLSKKEWPRALRVVSRIEGN